ncbi:MAG: hypothetical protein IT581_02350 [Verrucomicrobiales bacterium]|nr:hypothetical protein [Verrucomicrobiales bacterium]
MNPNPTNPTASPLSVRLHIERLVLDGVPGNSRDLGRLRAALETELGRLLGDHASAGLSGGSTHLAKIAAPEIRWATNTDPAESGRDLARAIFSGMSSTLRPAGAAGSLGFTPPTITRGNGASQSVP